MSQIYEKTRRDVIFPNPHAAVTDCSFRTPSGRTIKRWIVVERKQAVVIAGRTPEGKWLFILEERPVVGKTMTALPAGQLDPDEPAEVTASREFLEETGHAVSRILPLGPFNTSPGFTDEQTFLFYAPDITKITDKLGEMEEGIMGLVFMSTEEVWAGIASGLLEDANTLAMFARLHASGLA